MNRALDAYAMRQQVTSKNIANAVSPHYRPEKVKFEEFFQEQDVEAKGTETDDRHIPIGKSDADSVQGEVEDAPVPKPEIYFSGENHVNIDKEMSNMAQNQIRYRFASRMVKRYFSGLGSAISGFKE
jgi:flagellar basal-body rod protein FlgB